MQTKQYHRLLALLMTIVTIFQFVIISPDVVFAEETEVNASTESTLPEESNGASSEANPVKATKTGTVLAFTSDVHNGGRSGTNNDSANRIATWIDKVVEKYGGIDAMAFGGDMGSAYLNDDSFWTYSKNAMDKVPSGIKQVHTTGNHEMSNGSFSSTTNSVKNNYKVGEIGAEGDNYVIYCLGSTSSSQTYTYTSAVDNDQVEKLTSFLDKEEGSRIIFIITHFPLHYYSSQRTTKNADKVIDALNNAADAGKTIVYLWGHNHTNEDSAYDFIFYDTDLNYDGSNTKHIKFYYGAAGCMSDNEYGTGSEYVQGKGLVVQIENTRSKDLNLTFDYLNASGSSVVEDGTVQNTIVSVKSVTTFVQTDELVAGKEYIIAGEADSEGNVLILSNEATGTAKQLKGVSTTVSNNTITISDDVLDKVLFNCVEDSTSTLGGLQLESGGSYLYSSNTAGLSMHTLDSGRCWHYRAYDGDTDKHILWLIKDTVGVDGWSSAGDTYKYYLDYSSGTYFTDKHVENGNTVQGTSDMPKVYLYTVAPEGETYTLSYDANGGTGSMSSQTNKTVYTVKANSFSKEGFEFTKWNTKADGSGTDYEQGASITLTEDTILYAQWTKATTVDHTVYVLTSSLTVGEKYLIVNTNVATSANGAHAIGMNNSAVADDTVTVNAGITATNNTLYIDSDDVNDTTAWTVGGSSTSPTFTQGSSYLYPSSSGVSISTTSRTWSTSTSNPCLRYRSGNYGNYNYLNYNNGWTMTSSSSSSTYPVYFYEETTIKVSVAPGITVEPESAIVGIGDTKTLTAIANNVDGTPAITWSSNNTAVATVDQTGKVTGVSAGQATITASMTYDGETYTDTCMVTVKQVNTLSYDYIGEALTGTAYVIVSNGYALVNNNGTVAAVPATVNGNSVTLLDDEYAEADMLWTLGEDGSFKNGNYYVRRDSGNNKDLLLSTDSPSSNVGYMCFAYDGDYITVVSTSSQGSGTVFYIYYDSGWKSSSTQPTVKTQLYGKTVAVTDVIVPATVSVDVGGTTTLTATVLPEDATNKEVAWSCSDETVATVDNNGLVTGIKAGTATITVTTEDGGKTASCTVTVNAIAVTGVTLDKTEASVGMNGSIQLTATVLPENASNKGVIWNSSKPETATVDSTGKVTGVAEGSVIITVTTEDGGKTASCTVTVTKQQAYVIVIGDYALSTTPSNDQLVNSGSGSQKYYYTGLAGVEFTSGSGAGDHIRWIITETTGGYYIKSLDGKYLNATYETNDTGGSTGVLKLDSTPDIWTLGNDATLDSWQLNGTTLKSTNANKSLTHEEGSSSSPINLFTVRSTGETSTLEVAADPVSVTGVTVNPVMQSVEVGKSVQFTANVTPDNASNKSVTWSSSNEAVVMVNADGVVTAISIGNATITVTTVDGGKTDTAQVTVTEPKPGEKYILVDSLKNGNEYLIVSAGSVGDAYALKNSGGTLDGVSVQTAAVVIKSGDANGDGTSDTYIETLAEDIVWTANTNSTGFDLTNDGSYFEFKSGSLKIFKPQKTSTRFWEYNDGQLQVLISSNGSSSYYNVYFDGTTFNQGSASTNRLVYIFEKVIDTPHSHTYGNPEWSWNADHTEATATFTCEANDDTKTEKDNNPATVEVTAASCTADRVVKYTAKVTFEGEEYTTETENVTLANTATGHHYSEPEWSWNADHTEATATFTCEANDDTKTVKDNNPATIEVTAASCTSDRVVKYTAKVTFEGEEYTTATENVTLANTATGHHYSEPEWNWNADHTEATATFACTACDDTQTVIASISEPIVVEPTPTENGSETYTATVTGPDGKIYTDEKVISLPATGYTFKAPVYQWTQTASGFDCTAVKECNEDPEQSIIQTVSATPSITTEPGCETEGVKTWTAVFSNTSFVTQTQIETIPALEHDWEFVDISWTETANGYTAVANYKCSHNDEHTKTVDAAVTSQTTAATCETAGQTVYTATVAATEDPKGQARTADKTVEIEALGHDWEFVDISWTEKTGGYTAVANYKCSHNEEHTKTVDAAVTSQTTAATCETAGQTVYTASVAATASLDEEEHSDSKTVTITALGHDWSEPTYTWSTDHKSVTARFVCNRVATHIEDVVITEGITSSVTTAPSATQDGVRTYTVSFSFGDKTYTATTTEVIPALGTGFGGTVKSFGSKTEEIILTLTGNGFEQKDIVTGNDTTYAFESVPVGTYTLTVSKLNHATRTYTDVVVGVETAGPDVEIKLLGDLNGDGKVTTFDAARVNSHARGVSQLSGYDLVVADVLGPDGGPDGQVTTADAGRINTHARKIRLLWEE